MVLIHSSHHQATVPGYLNLAAALMLDFHSHRLGLVLLVVLYRAGLGIARRVGSLQGHFD